VTQSLVQKRWVSEDLELLPSYEQSGNRYEIIDGELFVARAPHWKHQSTCGNIFAELKRWSSQTKLGQPSIAPGIIFTNTDNVIPDLVWASNQVLTSLDRAGHLTVAPELVVEVLSSGKENEHRDRVLKLGLYAEQGVQEYWLVDWQVEQLEIYRLSANSLSLIDTLANADKLTSPLLPGLLVELNKIFA
jgi:Uma2 family endonuclease